MDQRVRIKGSRIKGSEFLDQRVRVLEIPASGTLNPRSAGLYSPGCRDKLNQARQGLGQAPLVEKELLHWEAWLKQLGHERLCRHCQGKLVSRKPIPARLRAWPGVNEDTARRCGVARGRQEAVDGLRVIRLNEETAPPPTGHTARGLATRTEIP